MIYLDWNATAPPHPEVLAAMRAAWESAWANPASVHGPGRRARAEVERAREAVAGLTGFDARDVVLTSGGTEANNLAIAHAFAPSSDGEASAAKPGGALVLSRIEHPSVIRAAEALAARGVAVEWAEVARSGRVEVEAMVDAMERASRRAELRLVALQAVNHETGVVQSVAAIASHVRSRGARLFVDAIQAIGRLDPASWAGADLVTVAAHKLRGPKGIGALVTRPGLRVRPILVGGAQERGLRPGTQDGAACAGFTVAAERGRDGASRYAALAALRDELESALFQLGDARGGAPIRNGDGTRAPHVSNLSWPGWRSDELAAALDLEGVAVSAGSACSAGTSEPSPVLRAMVGEARAASAIRVSIGEETTRAELSEALAAWSRVLSRAVAR